MDDSTLHVEPSVTRAGAGDLTDGSEQMTGVMRSVSNAYGDLLKVWTGPASKVSEGKWSDAETAFGQHIGQLNSRGESVHTSTTGFVNTDDTVGEGFVNLGVDVPLNLGGEGSVDV